MNIIYLLIFVFIIYLFKSFIEKNKKYDNLKAPLALPIIGHLHLLGGEPIHLALMKMIPTYGNNFKLWVGDHLTLFVSEPEMLREIFVKNFNNFVNRHRTPVMQWASSGFIGLTGGDHEYWIENKNLVVSSFSNQKIRKITHIIESQVQKFVDVLGEYADQSMELNPRQLCQKYTLNVIFNYIYSKELPYDEDLHTGTSKLHKLLKAMDDCFVISGSLSVADMFHFLAPFRLAYLYYWRNEETILKNYIKEIYEDHLNTIDRENPRDLMDSFICQLDITKPDQVNRILVLGMELMAVGSETTSSTMEWFILLMANHPEIQEKIYAELKSVQDSQPGGLCIANRSQTPYLNAAIKECQRYKPTGPFNIPRTTKEDIQINDLFIPKGTQILHFHYAMMYNEQNFMSPTEFIPERFINDNHSHVFHPFSLGSRNCIGQSLATDEIYLVLVKLLHSYKIMLPDGISKLDETEQPGMTFKPKEFNIKIVSR
ncbi:cytochrome P450 family protein [Tieghemostelium lacteum]|uniref:Cytochrome P450 family protein n=1 Tax=Tieghemostelium lacteum TaxID=361077 RepID=A0A152A5C0_TIELA|nr:cytochrome P450 family protein [Tieghemostelium lacteum]|eukprot:KYR01275.1 cytochrome P450 family protein [Tieghemostelium lacteum]